MQAANSIRRRLPGTNELLRAMLLFLWGLMAGHSANAGEPEGVEVFESKIRPLLVEHCQKCHGAEKQWSGLRLDSRAAALAGGDNGPALVAGNPDDSELVKRITS